MLLAFAAGLASFLSPCVLPPVPPTSSIWLGRRAANLLRSQLPAPARCPPRASVLLAPYRLGLSVPFLLLCLAVDRGVGLVRGLGRWRRVIDVVSGGILIAMGALLMTNNLFTPTSLLSRLLPSQLRDPFGL